MNIPEYSTKIQQFPALLDVFFRMKTSKLRNEKLRKILGTQPNHAGIDAGDQKVSFQP